MRTDHRVHTCGGDMDTPCGGDTDTPCGGDMSMDYGYAGWGLCGQTTRYTVMRIMPCGGSVLDEIGIFGRIRHVGTVRADHWVYLGLLTWLIDCGCLCCVYTF